MKVQATIFNKNLIFIGWVSMYLKTWCFWLKPIWDEIDILKNRFLKETSDLKTNFKILFYLRFFSKKVYFEIRILILIFFLKFQINWFLSLETHSTLVVLLVLCSKYKFEACNFKLKELNFAKIELFDRTYALYSLSRGKYRVALQFTER